MDKRIILAVAGSGKTTYLLNTLTEKKRTLIVTYTNNNYSVIQHRIISKFGFFPNNIRLLTYFSFLYSFCYRPFLARVIRDNGITYVRNQNVYAKQEDIKNFYMDKQSKLFSNRIAKLILSKGIIQDISNRLSKYFDNFLFDEVQDLAGNDFNFFLALANSNIELLATGDFFQHTFDTSTDGNINKTLYSDFKKYKGRLSESGLLVDEDSLKKSYRCSPTICSFINENLGISIESHKTNETRIQTIYTKEEAEKIFQNRSVIKLFYEKHYDYNCFSKNWGECKGENDYFDVCVILNQNTDKFFKRDELINLPPVTKNKLYVAISRTNNNLYFLPISLLKKLD